MPADPRIEQYLELSRLGGSGKLFTIGPFFSNGITLRKQQVRALNLVYSLAKSDPPLLSRETRVAVIGGGIAGATAAAAAVYLGCGVDLFEQRPVLCHLQHGCDTRHVHPNIYDWPDPGSDNPYADLPLLSWKAGTAAEVTRQIVAGFEELVKEAEPSGRFRRHLGATTRVSDGGRVSWDNSIGEPRGGERPFDLIVLATGFGVELGVGEGAARSYWRNDDINQPTPGITSERRQLHLISGTGDGGLVDLLRCRIKGFNQGWLLDELVPSDDSILIQSLKRIAADWKAFGPNTRRRQRRWLYDRYLPLAQTGILGGLMGRLRQRLRGDTTAILNGRSATFAEVLRLDSASLFNTLLTFLLYELDAFSYVNGLCRSSETDGEATIEQDPLGQMERPHNIHYQVDRLIIRHGTDLRKPLRMLGVSNAHVEDLERRQRPDDGYDTTEPLWAAGWWSDERRRRLNPSDRVKRRQEFVPPATVALATTFVSTLSAVLVEQLTRPGEPQKEFRATLHRVLEKRGESLFQQIAFYQGDGTRLSGKPARVFDVRSGLVGLACRLGRPILLNCGTPDDRMWIELWRRLEVGEDIQTPPQDVEAMLACPLFARPAGTGDADIKGYVSMILFMDSQNEGFFNDRAVRRLVFAACAGFVRNLNRLGDEELENNKIVRFPTSDYPGYPVPVNEPGDDRAILREYADLISEVSADEIGPLMRESSQFRARSSLDMSI